MLQVIDGMSSRPNFTAYSQRELDADHAGIVMRQSENVRSLVDNGEILLVCGIYIHSLTAYPELWLLVCTGFNRKLRRNIKTIRIFFQELIHQYGVLRVKVEANNPVNIKFAEFMGFTYVGEGVNGLGTDFRIYEVRK